MNIKSEKDENINSFIVKGEYSIQEFSTGGTALEDADGIKFEITEVKVNDNQKNSENQCYICGKNFTRQANLKMHMGIHGPSEMAYNCAHCSSSFMDKNDLIQHISSHTRGSSGENGEIGTDSEDLKMFYHCPHCPKVCKYEKNYFRHLQCHWKAKSYECGICSKKFRWKAYLNRHMIIHLKPQSYPCNFCDKSYQRKDHLRHHIMKHVAKFHNCPYCSMVSIEKSDLEEHVKTAHPGLPSNVKDSKQHPCTTCKKIFRTPKMLQKHERTHFCRQRLECKTCGQICYEQEELDQHIEQEHNRQEGINPVKRIGHPFLCPHCGKGFRVKSYFLAHLEIHSEDPIFKCGICNKKFKKKQVLTVHMRIHEKGKPLYPCKICERVFKSEKTLIRHEKGHDLEEETMQCPDCNGSGYVRADVELI